MVHATWYIQDTAGYPRYGFPENCYDDDKQYYIDDCIGGNDGWSGYKGQPIALFTCVGRHKNAYTKFMKIVNEEEPYSMWVKFGKPKRQTFRSDVVKMYSYYHPQKHFNLKDDELEAFKKYFNIVEYKEDGEKIIHHIVQ